MVPRLPAQPDIELGYTLHWRETGLTRTMFSGRCVGKTYPAFRITGGLWLVSESQIIWQLIAAIADMRCSREHHVCGAKERAPQLDVSLHSRA